jgi:outer membrane biosynthesis protein TonB
MTQHTHPPTLPWLAAALRLHLLVGLLAIVPLAGAQAAATGAPVVRITTPAEQVVADGAAAEIPAEAEEVGVEVAAAGVGSFVLELDGVVVATVDAPSATAIDVPVAAGGDAEEFLEPSRADPVRWPTGFTYVSSSDLEFGHDPSHGDQVVAVRFVDLGIPAGARILWAEVVFTADGRSDGELRLLVWGERAADGAPFVEDAAREPSGGLSSRARTDATVPWSLEEAWRAGERYATPDLSAIVQEVVDLDGWHADAVLVLLFEAAETGTTFRRAVSVSASGDDDTRVARLHVDYLWPAAAALPAGATFAVAPGRSELMVSAFAGTAGRGEMVGATQLTLERPAIEAEPESVAEPIAEPEPEAEPAAAPEPVEEPAPVTEPEPDAEPAVEPEPDAEPIEDPAPVTEPEPDTEPDEPNPASNPNPTSNPSKSQPRSPSPNPTPNPPSNPNPPSPSPPRTRHRTHRRTRTRRRTHRRASPGHRARTRHRTHRRTRTRRAHHRPRTRRRASPGHRARTRHRAHHRPRTRARAGAERADTHHADTARTAGSRHAPHGGALVDAHAHRHDPRARHPHGHRGRRRRAHRLRRRDLLDHPDLAPPAVHAPLGADPCGYLRRSWGRLPPAPAAGDHGHGERHTVAAIGEFAPARRVRAAGVGGRRRPGRLRRPTSLRPGGTPVGCADLRR